MTTSFEHRLGPLAPIAIALSLGCFACDPAASEPASEKVDIDAADATTTESNGTEALDCLPGDSQPHCRMQRMVADREAGMAFLKGNVPDDLVSGRKLLVDATPLGEASTVVYFRVPQELSEEVLATGASLAEGTRDVDGRQIAILGGKDADRPHFFRDVEPGLSTVCVEHRPTGMTTRFEAEFDLAAHPLCAAVRVDSDPASRVVRFESR